MTSQIESCMLLLLLVQMGRSCTGSCPEECRNDCCPQTFKCEECLQKFFRVFNGATNDCECFENFRELHPPGHSCCPSNCSACSTYGCATCRRNWVSAYSQAFFGPDLHLRRQLRVLRRSPGVRLPGRGQPRSLHLDARRRHLPEVPCGVHLRA